MARGSKLPRFTVSDVQTPEGLTKVLNQFAETLELRLTTVEAPLVDPRSPAVGEEVYAVTNATEQRAFDADTVTLAELADVVGTFFEDLKEQEKLK